MPGVSVNFAGPNRRGGLPLKYPLTDPVRELLLREYDSKNRREIAARLGVPPWVITKWAGAIGIRRTKEKPWSREEIEYLETRIYRSSWKAIAKHLGRTVCAVQLKAKRIGTTKLGEGYTARQVADLFGVDIHKVTRWIKWGAIRARRRQTDRADNDPFYITDDALRSFIREYPQEIDLRRVDKFWFIGLAFGSLGRREEAA